MNWRSVFADAATDGAVAGDVVVVGGGDVAVYGGSCVVFAVFHAHCHHSRRHQRCR